MTIYFLAQCIDGKSLLTLKEPALLKQVLNIEAYGRQRLFLEIIEELSVKNGSEEILKVIFHNHTERCMHNYGLSTVCFSSAQEPLHYF